MARFFTLLEAEILLPEIERSLRACMQAKKDYEGADGQLRSIARQITFAGGMLPPRAQMAEARNRKDAAARLLKTAADRIAGTGCQLKDLDIGLVDFPALYKGQEVYLCWKLGEAGIRFWHYVADGFQGRREIDAEFLANHRGESGASTHSF